MIKIENFCHSYQHSKEVVHNLFLTVETKDIFGLIGPNGAGKTTTLHLLATLLHPTSGQAFIAGKNVVKEAKDVRQIIGYMPDHFGVYPNMTVEQFLDFFALAYQIFGDKRIQVIEEIIALLDLQEYRYTQTLHLSRGMRQRLGLARTLLHNPPVLILDEPASGLDPRSRREIMEILKELQNMGKTIIVSSHILSELAIYCNRIGIIENGRILAEGSLKEITNLVQKYQQIQFKVLDRLDYAMTILKKIPEVSRVEIIEDRILCDFTGKISNIPQIISFLLQNQVAVIGVQEYVPSLEEVFLRITKKS